MSSVHPVPAGSSLRRVPGLWQGVLWAFQRGGDGGGISRARLVWRALIASLAHGEPLRRWMAVVCELHGRGLITDLEGEYLRAVRPYVHRHTDVALRVVQLIDHTDWLETAFKPRTLERLSAGKVVVLAELPPPRGYEFMRLQLRRSSVHSPEGELLLTLSLQRSADIQPKAVPVDAAVVGFSRIRLEGSACLAIGGVRGQRHARMRASPVEISQAMQGWKPSILLIRVMQELARAWNLRLVGLNPASHMLQGWSYIWSGRHRSAAERIFGSYEALWDHFDAKRGPIGWMVLPVHSDEKLEATALSPEKRERQTRRADYWIRTRRLLRTQLRGLLLRPGREARLSRMTEAMTESPFDEDWSDMQPDDDSDSFFGPSRVLDTGPGNLA